MEYWPTRALGVSYCPTSYRPLNQDPMMVRAITLEDLGCRHDHWHPGGPGDPHRGVALRICTTMIGGVPAAASGMICPVPLHSTPAYSVRMLYMATTTAEKAIKKGVHHVGADVPISLFKALQDRSEQDGVPYSVVIRWALQDFLTLPPANG